MSLKVGELHAVMRLDDGQFTRGLDGAKGKFEGLKSAVGSGVKVMATAFAATTTAVAGLGIAALRVGLDYNRMQQTSRAALTTLLGSAEAANAQMDKLDEFARTSPFAKQVFIQAQQQLIGFGMAADDVLPTLDAIQNAVAAVGGSNDDISEITRILATVTSSGKITAETLNQLGVRGVDAATLIGEQMGKTGQEIRDSITNGSLDAGEAVKLLTDGMMARFGGATDNIKQQMDGAADRVKGAFRDIGSALAAPFIDPNGGGYLVGWTNDVADGMRNFEAKLRPLVDLLVARFTPGLQAVSPVIKSVSDVINAWDLSKVNRQLDELGRYTPIIAGVATAMFSLGTQSLPIVGAINPVVAGFAALAATSPQVRAMFGDWMDALGPLLPMLGQLGVQLSDVLMYAIQNLSGPLGDLGAALADAGVSVMSGLIPALSAVLDAAIPLIDVVGDVVGWITDLPAPVLAAGAAFLLFKGHLGGVNDAVGKAATAFQQFRQHAQVQATLGGVSTATGGLSVAMMGAQTAVKGVGTALKTAFISNPVGLAITGLVAVLSIFGGAQRDAKADVEELRGALDAQTGAWDENTAAVVANKLEQDGILEMYEAMGGKAADLIGHLEGNADATERYNAVMAEQITLQDDGIAQWQQLSSEGQRVQDAVDGMAWSLDEAAESNRRMSDVTREGADANQTAADAADAHRLAQEALRDELNEGIDASLSAAEAKLRVEDAAARTAEALDRKRVAEETLAEVMASGTATEEERTAATRDAEQATRDAERAILNQVRAVDNHIAAIGRNNGSYQEMRDEMARARESFIVQREQMGMTRAEAEALADQYGLVPSRIDTMVHLSGVQAALNQIGNLDATLNRINGKVVTATVAVRQYGQAAIATGGYVGHVAQGLAGGGAPWPRQGPGLVRGPGGPTDDLVNVRLSPTEFVVNSWATKLAGIGNLYALNAGRASIVPHLAGGGRPFEVTAHSYAPQPAPAHMTAAATTPTGPSRLHADDLTALADQLAAAVQAGSAAGTRAGFDDWQSSVALMERMRG